MAPADVRRIPVLIAILGVLRRPRVLLLLAITMQIIVFAIAQGDVPADDPLAYTENSYAITVDPAAYFREPANHPFVMRVGITLPLAALIRIFGVGQMTTNLPCLLATIAVLLVVFAAAKTARAKRIGLGLAALSSAFVMHGTELNADWLCGAATATSLLLLSRRQITGAVAVWFFAFLIKETTIWFAPAWLYVFVVDVRSIGWQTTARQFAPGVIVGAGLVLGYVAICAHVWGDPLARVHGIDALSDQHIWTSRGRSTYWWLRRLVWGPPTTYLAAFGVALILAFAGARRIRGTDRMWVVAVVSYLLLFWFGSASMSAYVPLPLNQPRMLMTVFPCVLVVAALAGDALRWHRRLAVTVGTASAVIFALALTAAVRRDQPEREIYDRIHATAARRDSMIVVCPDFRCAVAIPYWFGYHVPPHLQVKYVRDFALSAPDTPGTRVWVVVNRKVRPSPYSLPSTVTPIEALDLPRLYWQRNLRLYDAGDGTRLRDVVRPLVSP